MNEPYIRKKGNKFVLEYKDEQNKTKYLKTLPSAKVLYLLSCHDAIVSIASRFAKENSYLDHHKFAETLLTEVLDTPKTKTPTQPSQEDLKKLWELTK